MQFTISTVSLLAIVPLVLAHPASLPRADAGLVVSTAVSGIAQAASNALPQQPSNLDSDAAAFLSKYQTYSTSASDTIGPKANSESSAASLCFAETPCFSIENVSVVSMPNLTAISIFQISSILDSLLANPNTTFSNSNTDTVFTGLKTTLNGAVLEIIAPATTVPSAFVAGLVTDAYKALYGTGANAVRAVEAQESGFATPNVAICIYPDGVDATSVQNFCVGKELDGSPAPSTSSKSNRALERRFSLFGDICSVIDIPLLC